VPTFSDLRDELAQWQDEEKMQRVIGRSQACGDQTAERGLRKASIAVYSTGRSNIRTDNSWLLFFDVEGLSSDAHLETAMSMLIAKCDGGGVPRA